LEVFVNEKYTPSTDAILNVKRDLLVSARNRVRGVSSDPGEGDERARHGLYKSYA
jgi:hypothetical protein